MIVKINNYGFEQTKLLSYVGGKTKLSPYLQKLIPEHDVYVEVFGGGASLLFDKPLSKIEVYNDIDSNVVNLFRVLRDEEKAMKLLEKLELTPYSREEFNYCNENIDKIEDEVERARCLLVKFSQSYAGKGKHWGYESVRRAKKVKPCQIRKWLNKIELIEPYLQRLRRVFIENDDFRDLIPRYDSERAFFFLDPPYITKIKHYEYDMDLEDHKDLVQILLNVKGKAMLCGFEHEIYKVLEDNGWNKIGFLMPSTLPTTDKTRVEQVHYIWINYEIPNEFKEEFL